MSQPNAQAEHDAAFEAWREANNESLERAWREHLSYMQDSLEHRGYVATSDDAFEEYCYERFSDYIAEVNSALADSEPISRTGDE